MDSVAASTLSWVANFAVVNATVQDYLRPIMLSLIGVAGAAATLFLVLGGYEYMTSSGKPDKLEHAKKVIRNALLGLAVVIAAGTLTAILTTAYSNSGGAPAFEGAPALQPVDVDSGGGGITEILINSIIGLFKHVIESAGQPIINAIDFFTTSTPLMADNEGVFNLWLAVLGIANSLFILAVALMGFQIMSAASFGLDEIEFKHLLPKFGVTFLFMNMSIFAIDAVIGLSNIMISALSGGDSNAVFTTLTDVLSDVGNQGIVSLLLMIVFLVLSTLLLVYYVVRIIVLYVGAALAPVVILLQVIPGFKDFTATAMRTYFATIFNLFVHVVILLIAATLFSGLKSPEPDGSYNTLMSLVGGIAAIFTLLKTQQVITQMGYASTGPQAVRKLSSQFVNGVSQTMTKRRSLSSSNKPTKKKGVGLARENV